MKRCALLLLPSLAFADDVDLRLKHEPVQLKMPKRRTAQGPAAEPAPEPRVSAEDFRAMVETSKHHIVDGDVFQVVLSARFDLATDADPLEVYRVLRMLNPSPYLYLLSLETAEGVIIPLHVSVGSPTHPTDGSTAGELAHAAMRALRREKVEKS